MVSQNNEKKFIFIGAAWPYANGSLHLGHVASLIGADFLARYHRLKGDKVLFVSGSDCYGTPIAVKAEEQNVEPQEIANKYDQEFRETLIKGLGFSYDLFSKTANPFHRKVVQELFLQLLKKEYIYKKIQNLPYCEKCQRFLPDRYIEGVCPKCNLEKARGDQCDECGALLDAKELIKPKCKICSKTPIWKDSEHFFFRLTAFEGLLKKWVEESRGWRINAKNFTTNFLKGGLLDRAITRDTKWGVPVPLSGYENKSIYVWFEAVCGYLTVSQEYSQKTGKSNLWKEFWENEEAYHYYVHGKDNIPFHTIIWPAILLGINKFKLPDQIVSSEYLNFEGKQFSKSRSWGVWLPEFLEKYEPDTLRYYLGINGPENADGNFSWKEYQLKTNSELLGKFGNLVNRVISFTNNKFDSIVPERGKVDNSGKRLLKRCESEFSKVGALIEKAKFREVFKELLKFTDECNKYINDCAPWKTLEQNRAEAATTINISLQVVSALQTLFLPLLPFSAEEIRRQLNVSKRTKWKFCEISSGAKLNKAKPLYKKIET